MNQTKTNHIKTIFPGTKEESSENMGCGECQTSCQSACKTSCTIANQICEQEK
ncbi:MAG: six-cysteine ranthipeptide SCIFF [Defluviitaleaceae bacterium]|nr:six-cysteine ranthipeptide SCIFF [Defluviitaleaceae bacterium]